MAAVGSSVLSTTLQVLFDRIALNKNFLLDLFPENKKLQLNRLERVLQIVSQVLQDAENKQDKSSSVKRWFNSLKHDVYQADDVLDEINTDHLRIQMAGRKKFGKDVEKRNVKALGKRKRARAHHLSDADFSDADFSDSDFSDADFSDSDFSDADFSDQFIGELSPRLEEICEELERKVQKIGVFGLQILNGEQKREEKPPTTSVVQQSQIYGRSDGKEEIIQMVLSSEGGTNISVIPIIGMGGIGKTTLAQLVYNDERVNNHFQTRAWACVSEEFDIYRVTKDLLMEVNSSLVDEKDDLIRVQVKLKDNLERKRFIIILDDIWNENFDDYQRLMAPLNSGSRGSKIIVTTRNENIAVMLQNEPFHRLKPISEDQSWSLFEFELLAIDNRGRTLSEEFIAISETIVEKCKGLPLAIKTVAAALRSKDDIGEWRDVANNDNWMAEGDILPALSLSYKLLPSHLKCCFAFCAVFPKDAPFDKEETALLWMANDLVQPSSLKVARNYFEELRARSFFEMGNDNKYVMHDLINDLARHVSGYFCARMEDCQMEDCQLIDVHQGIQVEYDFPPEVLHCSYLISNVDTLERLRGLAQVQGLRTFLFCDYYRRDINRRVVGDILPKLRHIRTLSLLNCITSVIPDSIGDLKHLRLLNLARNYHIKKLPNGITKCLNLQTLILEDCESLKELPEDMGLLINLQTLILEGCCELKELHMRLLINLQTLILARCYGLEELPEDMRLLINLQHLDVRQLHIDKIWLSELKDIQNISIVVDTIHASVVEQMDKLQFGQLLTIFELDNGVTVEMARSVQLKNKDCIEELTLGWSEFPYIPGCSDDWDILAELRPHTNIRKLEIKGYRGTTFPNWVGDSSFCNLEELTLQYCENCTHLPPLGQLTGLKKLTIWSCDGLESLFQPSSLRSLDISVCPEMECFPDGGLPPSLETLKIESCNKLMKYQRNWGLQTLPSLIELRVGSFSLQGTEEKLFPEEGLLPATLKELHISYCDNLEALNPKGFQHITSLQKLHIYDCRELRCFPKNGLPSSLSKLWISNCPELRCFPEDGLSSSLSELTIINCPELRCLPEDGLPSSLEKLSIEECPKLRGRLEREKGEDWHKVMHIPNIYVDGKYI